MDIIMFFTMCEIDLPRVDPVDPATQIFDLGICQIPARVAKIEYFLPHLPFSTIYPNYPMLFSHLDQHNNKNKIH